MTKQEIEVAFRTYLKLEKGWNSYGANKISPNAVDYAWKIMGEIGLPHTVHPTPEGGISLNYHDIVACYDLELDISPDCKVGYLFTDYKDTEKEDATIEEIKYEMGKRELKTR